MSGKRRESKELLTQNNEDFNNQLFTHEELIKLTRLAVNKIIETDPLLHGLPLDPTVDEIKAQIAVAQGQAITLYLNRGELPKLAIVVKIK